MNQIRLFPQVGTAITIPLKRMRGDSELLIYWSAGRSNRNILLKPILMFTILLFILQLFLTIVVIPSSSLELRNKITDIRSSILPNSKKTIGNLLIEPTKIYVDPILDLYNKNILKTCAHIVKKITKKELSKKHQISDWSQRPLSSKQLQYAANDVRYLSKIYKILSNELSRRKKGKKFSEEIKKLGKDVNGLKLSKLSQALPASKNPKAYTVEAGLRLIAYLNSAEYLLKIVPPVCGETELLE